jgi:hypothetical protein
MVMRKLGKVTAVAEASVVMLVMMQPVYSKVSCWMIWQTYLVELV